MKPFDLERARAGDPVCTANSKLMLEVVYLKTIDKLIVVHPEFGAVLYCTNGVPDNEASYLNMKLYMAPKKVKRFYILYSKYGYATRNEAEAVVQSFLADEYKIVEGEFEE